MRLDITVGDKYRVIQDEDGSLRAERYGRPWRPLNGDGLVLALAQEIERLRSADLARLCGLCKCGVSVWVNEHRNYHETAAKYLSDRAILNNDTPVAEPEILAKMIETDTVVEVQFYPLTPIGFERVFHYDLTAALAEALRLREHGRYSGAKV